jgi:hypothetical protein
MLALLPPEGDAAATVGADTCAAGGGGAQRAACSPLRQSCSLMLPDTPATPATPRGGHNRVESGSERTSPTEIPEDASARLRFSYVAAKATDVALALGTCRGTLLVSSQDLPAIDVRSM